MINSIYMSNLNLNHNDKNQQNIESNTKAYENNYVEIEKFVMQYEDKIYFYDALYDYMNNFIKQKKIRFILSKDNPQYLGSFIEMIIKDWLKTKKTCEKYRSQLKQLVVFK